MRARPFYFEVKDMVTQFIAAFDDVVIGRYNKERDEQDQINVRYIYAPKERVMYDIINENKTLTLPAIAVNITSIARDTTRVFNKLDGFYYQGKIGEETVTRHIKSPIPINISLKVSILSRYQTDMDQIISNFVPFCNPYVIISWKVPEAFQLSKDQEIRSEVLWDGSVSMSYPVELTSSQKARVTADTTFTIKGWLFKDTANPVGNIFHIEENFYNENKLEYYDNFDSLSGGTFTFPTSTNLVNEVESFTLSGNPQITDIYYNGVLLQDDLTITPNTSGNIILNGYGFTHTETILFSTNNDTVYTNLTSVSGFSRQEPVSGQSIPFTVLNDNTIIFNSPPITLGKLRFIPLNKAGYDFSDLSYMDTLCGRGLSSTFIIVKDILPPIITLNGSNPTIINLNGSYTELSGRAFDLVDGVSPLHIYGDTVDDTSSPTTYTILYSAIDAAGNIGTTSRTVNIVDNILPVVTLNGDSSITIECGTTYSELCATALDNVDGSLPVTVSGSVNTHTPGTYTIEYLATDATGNTGSATRTVIVEDTIAPVVTLIGSSSINVECSTSYNEEGATALDDCDGVLSVTVGGDTVDANTLGIYTVTYSATDSSGNTGSVSRTIEVEDTIAPVVTLIGNSSINVECGTSYNEEGAIALDQCDGSLSVTVGGDTVDVTTLGTYTVGYSATDSSGNTGSVSRTVVVEDTIAPVVTLNGSSTINIDTDDTYNEQGATALDQCDGTLSVTTGGDTVDVSVAGTYVVTYSATDSSGNTGTNSRTVVVSEVSIPCGGQNSYSGNQGTFNYDINLGSATGGTSTLSYNAYNVPDRFVVTHGGVVVIDTGFVGTFSSGRVDDLDEIYGAGNWVQGGTGAGTASFVKTSADNIATVTVYGPLPNTAFEFALSCPV